jgi:DNA-binding NarL/FixJ family response regulator
MRNNTIQVSSGDFSHFPDNTERLAFMEQGTQTELARPRLLFADDHQLVLDALSLMAGPHFEVQTSDTLKGFEDSVDQFQPDVAVLDVRMPDGDGFEVARRVMAKYPSLKLMFLSMHTETAFMKRALDMGAKAYLSKRAPMDELMTAIRTVLSGGKYSGSTIQTEPELPADSSLTERQIEVLRLISQGCSAKEIASRLSISVRTAEFHRAAIMDRLKLHSTAMITRYAIEHGLT